MSAFAAASQQRICSTGAKLIKYNVTADLPFISAVFLYGVKMVIKNAEIFDKDFEKVKKDIEIKDSRIGRIGNCVEGNSLNFEGCIVLPGFIDIHTHGCGGYDVTDGKDESAGKMSQLLAENGVTSFCPTTMTVGVEKLEKAFSSVRAAMGVESGAYIHGINMEGPFISPEKKGAQNEKDILPPDFELFEKLNSICPVKVVDIAPEMPGAFGFIQKAKEICPVSAAHTTADYETAKAAFDRGINHATHLFNAMPPLLSRKPGVVGAVFDDSRVYAELICDGVHIAPAVLRTAFRALGEDRAVVISDSMSAAGMPDGEYALGGQTVFVRDGKATLEDGTVAGGTSNLFEEFKNLIKFGIPVKQAVKACTINPAKSIGADDIAGSIETGKNADLLVLNGEMTEIKAVFIKGKKVI